MKTSGDDSGIRLLGDADQLFASSRYPKQFEFNAEVAGVFDDMVRRSIPLYADVTDYAADWTVQYYQPGTRIYDIGCSTGTAIDFIGRRLQEAGDFVGVDSSAAMIEKAREKLAHLPPRHEVDLLCHDAMTVPIENASIVIVNYTLQFIPIANRRTLLKRIYNGLRPGGVLFVSEKVRSACPEFQETATRIHEGFKEQQGYSRTEIERKKEALENVLVPLTEDQQKAMIQHAGFTYCDSVIKWNNFVSLVAVKDSF